jgi:hypothetical protein
MPMYKEYHFEVETTVRVMDSSGDLISKFTVQDTGKADTDRSPLLDTAIGLTADRNAELVRIHARAAHKVAEKLRTVIS